MSGVVAHLTSPGLDALIQRVAQMRNANLVQFADNAGAVLESSTRERFETKKAPDGSAWAEWSDIYAATREAHHSLLVGEQSMLDSIASYTSASQVEVGSNLVYAAHHHFGGDEIGTGMPARPFLGVSDQDEGDLQDLANDWLGGLLQ